MICVCGHAEFRHRNGVCMADDVRRPDGVTVHCDCVDLTTTKPPTGEAEGSA